MDDNKILELTSKIESTLGAKIETTNWLVPMVLYFRRFRWVKKNNQKRVKKNQRKFLGILL